MSHWHLTLESIYNIKFYVKDEKTKKILCKIIRRLSDTRNVRGGIMIASSAGRSSDLFHVLKGVKEHVVGVVTLLEEGLWIETHAWNDARVRQAPTPFYEDGGCDDAADAASTTASATLRKPRRGSEWKSGMSSEWSPLPPPRDDPKPRGCSWLHLRSCPRQRIHRPGTRERERKRERERARERLVRELSACGRRGRGRRKEKEEQSETELGQWIDRCARPRRAAAVAASATWEGVVPRDQFILARDSYVFCRVPHRSRSPEPQRAAAKEDWNEKQKWCRRGGVAAYRPSRRRWGAFGRSPPPSSPGVPPPPPPPAPPPPPPGRARMKRHRLILTVLVNTIVEQSVADLENSSR